MQDINILRIDCFTSFAMKDYWTSTFQVEEIMSDFGKSDSQNCHWQQREAI